jgi:hypothetical protein
MVDKFEANPKTIHTLLRSWKTPRHMKYIHNITLQWSTHTHTHIYINYKVIK